MKFHNRLRLNRWTENIMQATTFPCWIQSEMKVVVWCFCSNEVYFVHQLHRSLVLPLPLHDQLTFRDPLTWLKLICILPRDLDLSMGLTMNIDSINYNNYVKWHKLWSMLHSQWGKWMVLFSNPPLSLVHPQECPGWFHCVQIRPVG